MAASLPSAPAVDTALADFDFAYLDSSHAGPLPNRLMKRAHQILGPSQNRSGRDYCDPRGIVTADQPESSQAEIDESLLASQFLYHVVHRPCGEHRRYV